MEKVRNLSREAGYAVHKKRVCVLAMSGRLSASNSYLQTMLMLQRKSQLAIKYSYQVGQSAPEIWVLTLSRAGMRQKKMCYGVRSKKEGMSLKQMNSDKSCRAWISYRGSRYLSICSPLRSHEN